jgi:hypothetical protein
MGYHLTFNASTKLWTVNAANGYVVYPSTVNAAAGGPYNVDVIHIPFDPVHKTGGSFWLLQDGPNAGAMVSSSTNRLHYGSITVTNDDDPGTPGGDEAKVNPLADWRILIKGMGGADGDNGSHAVLFNEDTQLWTRNGSGIIAYDTDIAHGPAGDATYVGTAGSGPYKVLGLIVPYDPIHETGGSFWELKEGPHSGFLVSAHTNSLGYGDITVTAGNYNRGPGATLATLYHPNPHLAGFSKLYNQGGEFHMTLLVDDPNILVPVPKQTHYAVEFEVTPGEGDWVEVAAGMIWDLDQTDTEAVFYGIDYLALFQFVVDERFDPTRPDRPTPNGSKFVGKTIKNIVTQELGYAVGALDSPVGFIHVGDIADMTYSTTIYATFQDTLSFVIGLLNSWRAGSGKLTELRVQKREDGEYEVVVEDDPGIQRPDLSLEYGVLAQGYKVRQFGQDWASRVNMIGRDLNGSQIKFQTIASPQMMAKWGRISGPVQYQDVVDDADLRRRTLQASIDTSRIGRQVGVGTKLGSYRPFEAYNLLDMVPVIIRHGAIDTTAWDNDEFLKEDEADGGRQRTTTGTWAIIGVSGSPTTTATGRPRRSCSRRARGAIKLGDVQGAFGVSSFPGDAVPTLPRPTTPQNILIAFVVHQNFGTSTSNVVFHDDPSLGLSVSTDWTVLGQEHQADASMNIGVSGENRITVAWRRVTETERTTHPVGVSTSGTGVIGLWLYEVPADVVPSLAGLYPSQNVTGNPETFTPDELRGNLLGLWAFTQADYGNQPEGLTASAGSDVITSAALNNDPLLDNNHGWTVPWVAIVSTPAGGQQEVTFDPISAYTSANGMAVIIKMPAGVILPAIPYPIDQVSGFLSLTLDGGGGDSAPPPADGSGVGPPDETTPATSTYTDLSTGQQYEKDPDTEEWVPVVGTSFEESGRFIFPFASASTWVVSHDLLMFPPVTVVDGTGQRIWAHVVYDSDAQITITFSEAVAGTVYLR